ncbi:hypothetical protein MMC06_004612 [Schaereria dolodes]|nr:hypothetical protein [Schaereria dolodes]
MKAPLSRAGSLSVRSLQTYHVRVRSYRTFYSTTPRFAGPSLSTPLSQQQPTSKSDLGPLANLSNALNTSNRDTTSEYHGFLDRNRIQTEPPHHLHIYSTKHNTHLTLTKPDRGPIISVSAGSLGFRKAGRGTYDAAYQLGAYMMGRIQEQGLLTKIGKLELVLRGYGRGREAVTKILLGSEGMNLRPRICRVTDATRLKFGGNRSKKLRRLG